MRGGYQELNMKTVSANRTPTAIQYFTFKRMQHAPCLTKKLCQNFFCSELRQIFINFNNFWWADGKITKVVCHSYIFNFI